MAPRLLLRVLLVVLALAGLGWAGFVYQREARTLTFVIPAGTAARIAAGESVTVFPNEIQLSLRQQDTLVIRNADQEPVTIGPFRIAPGQQFRQRYWSPGTYELVCSIHSGNQLRILVEP